MKPLLLISGALLSPVTACEKSDISHLGRAHSHVIAALQADKSTSKTTRPTTPAPPKKPAPKERERPTPPAHLFM